MRDGPEPGLKLIDELLARGELAEYPLVHSARAELFRKLGRASEARQSYERALGLTSQEPQRRFLRQRMEGLLASHEQ
jgi:RNA polymerase sigma-70 factor (ECF subfamily)